MTSTWEFVTRLFLLPFTIMQRISRNIFSVISRALYSSDPAIKPPPEDTVPSRRSSSESIPIPGAGESTEDCPGCLVKFVDVGTAQSYAAYRESFKNIKHIHNQTHNQVEISLSDMDIDITSSSANRLNMRTDKDEAEDKNDDDERVRARAAAASPVQLALVNELTGEEEELLTYVTHPTHTNNDDNNDPKSNEKRLSESPKRSEQVEQEKCADVVGLVGPCHHPKRAKLTTNKVEGHTNTMSSSPSSASPSTSMSAPTSNSSLKKRKKAKKKRTDSESEQDSKGSSQTNMGKVPPNYFIAVEVCNKDIVSKVEELQRTLSQKTVDPPWHGLKSTEIFKDAMVPITKLHFTLYVMHLKDQQEVERAKIAVRECGSELCEEFRNNPLDLTIEGLGHFKNSVSGLCSVIFAQIKGADDICRLTRMSDLVREKLGLQNIFGDLRPFMPHMTIAKISRSNKLHKMKIRGFPPEIMKSHEGTHFGIQRVEGLQLLAMQGEDKTRGYYRCMGEFRFIDQVSESCSSSSTQEPGSSSSPSVPSKEAADKKDSIGN